MRRRFVRTMLSHSRRAAKTEAVAPSSSRRAATASAVAGSAPACDVCRWLENKLIELQISLEGRESHLNEGENS